MRMLKALGIIAALDALLAVPGVAKAQVTEPGQGYAFQVQARGESDVYEVITTGRCRILTAGTFNTDATVYTDGNLSTAATTLTAAGFAPTIALDATGTCKWFMPTGTNSADVIVYIDSGSYAGLRSRIDGVTRTGLKQALFTRNSAYRMLSIPFRQNTSTITSTTKVPAGAVVQAASVEVTTAVGAATVNFGAATPLTPTSFCSAASAASAGFVLCSTTLSTMVGSTALALQYSTTASAVTGFLNIFYLITGGS